MRERLEDGRLSLFVQFPPVRELDAGHSGPFPSVRAVGGLQDPTESSGPSDSHGPLAKVSETEEQQDRADLQPTLASATAKMDGHLPSLLLKAQIDTKALKARTERGGAERLAFGAVPGPQRGG